MHRACNKIIGQDISRRAFVLGGLVTIATPGLFMTSCKQKKMSIDVGVANSVENFDLQKDAYPLIISAGWHVFQSLYARSYNDNVYVPDIALSDPIKVADLVYDVKINTDLQFSNGDKLTVQDVYESLSYVSEDAIYSSVFDFISQAEMLNDNQTIRFYFNYEIGSLFKTRLSLLRVIKIIDTEEDGIQVIGTGPWVYESGDGSDESTLEFSVNEFYKGNNPATADKMIWYIYEDDDRRVKEALDGNIDVVERVKPQYFSELEKNNFTVSNQQTSCMPMLAFNTLSKPFNDINVRQAILYAIDNSTIISDIYLGYGSIATSIIPEYSAFFNKAKYVYNYNPVKAKQLLEASGFSRFKFDLLNFSDEWGRLISRQIQTDLNNIGIICNIRESEIDWTDFSKMPEDNAYEVALFGTDPTYFGIDPDILINMYWGEGIGDYLTNWSQTDPTTWNHLLELSESARTAAEDDRMKYWTQCYDVISENVSMYPLCFRNIASAWRNTVIENFEPIPIDGISLIGAKLK